MHTTDHAPSLHCLLATDGSAASLAAAHWLVHLATAGLPLQCTALAVQPPVMVGQISAIAPASITIEAQAQQAAQALAQVSGMLQAAGLPHTTETRMDDVAKALVARADALGAGVIVIGRRGIGTLRSALLGSVSAEVVRSANVPVMLVNGTAPPPDTPPQTAQPPLKVLLALDGSDNALRAADFAAQLAHSPAVALHVLHVRPTLTVAEAIFSPRERLLAHWSAEQSQQALAPPLGLLQGQGIAFEEHAASNDDPAQAILSSAQALSCSMIVMGTRGLGGVAGLLLGSVTQQVLAHAKIPVTLVR